MITVFIITILFEFSKPSSAIFIQPQVQLPWNHWCDGKLCNPCQMCISTYPLTCNFQFCPHHCAEKLCPDPQAVCRVVLNQARCMKQEINSHWVQPAPHHGHWPSTANKTSWKLPLTNGKLINPTSFRTPIIPRSVMLMAPDRTAVQLSPDGEYIGFIAPLHRSPNIWVQRVDDAINQVHSETPVTFDLGPGIRSFLWTHLPGVILFTQDNNGDENHRLYKVNVFTKQKQLLAGAPGVKVRIEAGHKDFPNTWYIGINNRDRRHFDLYQLNINSGKLTPYLQNTEGFASFIFDQKMQLKLAAKPDNEGGVVYYRPITHGGNSDVAWSFYRHVSFDDELTTKPLRFNHDNTLLYWQDSTFTDKTSLVLTNFETRAVLSNLYLPTKSDIGPILWHPKLHTPMAAIEDYTKPKWVVLVELVRADIEYLGNFAQDTFPMISGATTDFNKWLITMVSDDQVPSYYIYDRSDKSNKRLDFLFYVNKVLPKFKLSKMHAVEVRTRDNLTQVCYLSIPPDADPSGSGHPRTPGPMVLKVHSGPWARDKWGFNPSAQLWANRGYSMLQCNFRGSTGYGKRFIRLGNGEWGGRMQNDLLDAVQWAVGHGIADPMKIAIYGGSYGGYAVLAGLTFAPNVFACGVDMVGPSNLITLLKAVPPTWRPFYKSMKKRIGGDPDTKSGRDFLRSISPLFFAHRINKPLLIAQGANDPRVKRRESDQIVQALNRNRIPVTYLVFHDEGHGFMRVQNQLAHLTVAEQFLAECLGGRAEPLGPESFGTSMQVVSKASFAGKQPWYNALFGY